MRAKSRLAFALGLILTFLFEAQDRVQAQSYGIELNLGVEAYRNNHYEEAIEHFRKAVELDATKAVGRMYLGTAYASQFIPGIDSEDNVRLAEQAIEQYRYVLDSDAPIESRLTAAKGISYLFLNTKKFAEAKDYYKKASALDPKDPEPYYSIGVVDWTLCYQPRVEARTKLQMKPEENLSSSLPEQKQLCDELGSKNQSNIEEGIDSLKKAIELRPDYDDAMAYMNLMYRERADIECDDPAARAQDLKTADHWVDKTLATKKLKAEKADHDTSTAPNPQ